MHSNTHTHTCIITSMHIYMYTCAQKYIQHTYACIDTHVSTYEHTYIYTHTYTCAHVYKDLYDHIHAQICYKVHVQFISGADFADMGVQCWYRLRPSWTLNRWSIRPPAAEIARIWCNISTSQWLRLMRGASQLTHTLSALLPLHPCEALLTPKYGFRSRNTFRQEIHWAA